MADMNIRKTLEEDGLTVELLKADKVATESILERLLKYIWDKEEIPSGWTKGKIIKVPKKGDLTVCGAAQEVHFNLAILPKIRSSYKKIVYLF